MRANNGEIAASGLLLNEAMEFIDCKHSSVFYRNCKEGTAYKGFRIIQNDILGHIAKDNKVTVQLDNGEMREVPFTWAWQCVQEQKGSFRKKVQHG